MQFPIGIAANAAAVLLGAVAGGLMKKFIAKNIIDTLFMIFPFCALSIGVVSLIKLNSITVVVISVILGCVVGELCHIDGGAEKLIRFSMRKLEKKTHDDDNDDKTAMLSLAMALVCFSGTGIFGALSEGLDGDHSVLLAKSVLDLFTLVVIAAKCGWFVGLFALPQVLIFTVCFFTAGLVSPALTDYAIANFKAVGGVLTMAIGYNILAGQIKLKKIRVLNIIPALPLSLLFTWAASFLPFAV